MIVEPLEIVFDEAARLTDEEWESLIELYKEAQRYEPDLVATFVQE